jgi:tetratricopeptide (TPR) repeat protein
MPRRFPLLAALLLAALAAGCATSRPRGLTMDETVVEVNREDLELSRLNDEELFACGAAAYQAGQHRRAVKCFTRLADLFPDSPRAWSAAYNAGVAYEALGDFANAALRYEATMDPEHGQGDRLDAAWRAAAARYHLEDYPAAIALLERIVARADLSTADRLRALTHLGVCRLENGEAGPAEARFREALKLYRDRQDLERLEDYYPAQAQFFIGEIYRLHFEAVKLAAVDDLDKLGGDLEYKAELLLSAQGHYLRAIRMGNAQWGIAAGQRVGGLYEQLYDEMTNAPVPEGFDAQQAGLYRGMLRRKVRVLVQKAISIYERTLSTAERIGVEGAFRDRTRESLDRMKQALLGDAARDEAEGITDEDVPPPPPAKDGEEPPDDGDPEAAGRAAPAVRSTGASR